VGQLTTKEARQNELDRLQADAQNGKHIYFFKQKTAYEILA